MFILHTAIEALEHREAKDTMKIRKQFGPLGHERVTIRTFKVASDGHKFLNTGCNAVDWHEYTGELTPGTYAFAGGRWHNVKTLDAMALAHI